MKNLSNSLFKKFEKNIFILLINFFLVSLSAQDLVLSEQQKEFEHKAQIASSYITKVYWDPSLLPEAIKAYEKIFKINVSEKEHSYYYLNYADLLVQYGDLKKAIQYYDKAFNLKKMTAEEFGYGYRKDYFKKDTLLYNQKKMEYLKKMDSYYTVKEQKLLIEVEKILAIDQFARHYDDTYPQHRNCSKNIIRYADSITMENIIVLLEEYPEYPNPLSIVPIAEITISRHIHTAYPQFWLTYYEARCRKAVLDGTASTQYYAYMYDRSTKLTKGGYSYYGEWDNNGKNANPDKDLVNKRRSNMGLPILQEKETEGENQFRVNPTY